MALQFHRLRVAKVEYPTTDSISISLAIPAELKEEFSYEPGQYLTVKVFVNGEEFRRAYSLSSSPLVEDYLTITSKKVQGGKVSNFLFDFVKEGSELEVMAPLGNFTPNLDDANQKNYIFFSGGSGITPIFSILRTVLLTEPNSKVFLFYGNRNTESIIFHQELMDLRAKYGDRIEIHHAIEDYADEWKGYKGRIDREKANYFLKTYCSTQAAHAEYFICGPGAMMREVELACEDHLVPKEKVHIERFSASQDTPKSETDSATPAASADFDAGQPIMATIILDGESNEIEVKKGETILEAAIENDLDPPFACQIAACATCRAKCTEGTVSMDDREALTDSEMEEGFILTCQARPTSNKLIVDFDS